MKEAKPTNSSHPWFHSLLPHHAAPRTRPHSLVNYSSRTIVSAELDNLGNSSHHHWFVHVGSLTGISVLHFPNSKSKQLTKQSYHHAIPTGSMKSFIRKVCTLSFGILWISFRVFSQFCQYFLGANHYFFSMHYFFSLQWHSTSSAISYVTDLTPYMIIWHILIISFILDNDGLLQLQFGGSLLN